MSESPSYFAAKIAPTIGCILANIMWSSPMFSIRNARKERSLGKLNLVPYVMMLYCTFGWVLYGSLKSDIYIFWSNIPGMALGFWCTHSITAILTYQIDQCEARIRENDAEQENIVKDKETFKKQLFYVEMSVCFCPILWGLLNQLSYTTFVDDPKTAVDLVGWAAIVQTTIYFGAPASDIMNILKEKNSSSIYPPMIVTNATNCLMWYIYGMEMNDAVIWGPNVIGLILQVINGILVLWYPNRNWTILCSPLHNNVNVNENNTAESTSTLVDKGKTTKDMI